MTTTEREFFMDNVLYVFNGEPTPVSDLTWALFQPCGCMSGVHLVTADTRTEGEAFRYMAGSAAMDKQMRKQGCTMRLIRRSEMDWTDCSHSPKWGVEPRPKVPDHTWASTRSGRVMHLVPLVARDDAAWDEPEWTAHSREVIASVCGKAEGWPASWSARDHDDRGKVECAACMKQVQA